MRHRKLWIALLAIVALLAACKGESPTAPPIGGGGGGGGTGGGGTGGTTTTEMTLTVSNANPVIDSTVTITATVTIGGAPAPNGTAVEFSTTAGNFTDTNPPSTAMVRTTTNGVATAHLTHSAPATARVTAVVNSVIRTIDIIFRTVQPCVPPAPGCPGGDTPTVTGMSPTVGKPTGGEIVRITGTHLRAPVRVLFDLGGPVPVEASVVQVTDTFIDVITPAVNLGAGQQLVAPVIVFTEVGTPNETRFTVPGGGFTFRNTVLTPEIYSLSPTSGPINGGTRVTITGTGFQAPVQVFFGSAESQVVQVDFGRVEVIAPEGRATNPDGSGTVTGPVTVTLVNIDSNTRTTSPQTFRYVSRIEITAVSPVVGTALGGTPVVIDGNGFDAPVDVLFNTGIGVLQAQVLEVSGTRLRVRAPALPSACQSTVATITVRNVENGDTATASTPFQYVGVPPQIISVLDDVVGAAPDTAALEPPETIRVRVRDPGTGQLGTAIIRFTIVGRTIIPSPSEITTPTGNVDFTFALPTTGYNFPFIPCTIGTSAGVRLGPVEVPLTFTNTTTGCTDTVTVVITPPEPNPCIVPPQATVAPAAPSCVAFGNVTVGNSPTAPITFTNVAPAGAQDLSVNLVGITGANAAEFGIAPASGTATAGGGNTAFTVTFAPATIGAKNATATFSTNDPNRPTITVCLNGNGT